MINYGPIAIPMAFGSLRFLLTEKPGRFRCFELVELNYRVQKKALDL